MVFDLTKAYNVLKTGLIERHLRRFVYRFSPKEEWQDFAFDTVAFGDLPAANFLEIGRDLTADAGMDIDEEAAEKWTWQIRKFTTVYLKTTLVLWKLPAPTSTGLEPNT